MTTTSSAVPEIKTAGLLRGDPIAPQTWIDAIVVVILGVIGLVGFGSAFDSGSYLVAGVGGLVVGALAVILFTRLGFSVVLTVAATIVVWFLLGSAIAVPDQALFGFLPTLNSLASLSIGAVNGWSDILTLRTPVSLPAYINAVPYAAGTVVTLVSVLLAARWLRTRRTPVRASLLLVTPLALYLASVLLGTDQPYFGGIRGIAFAALALVWLGWRRRENNALAVAGGTALARRKLLGTLAVVLVAVIVGVVVGGVLTPPSSSRYVLRDRVQPPFQPLTYPTPLAGFREYTKTLNKNTLFTVSGLKAGQLLRLASLDTYNGEIWGVAGAQDETDSSGSFQLVGRHVPSVPALPSPTTSKLTVTIDDYSDVWMPGTGYAKSFAFDGAAKSADLENVRYNGATGTAVLTTGLHKGMNYQITDAVPSTPTDAALRHASIATFAPSLVNDTPDAVVSKTLEITNKATTPIGKLRALQQYLSTTGYFSHGTLSDQVPSRAGHGADRMYDMMTQPTMVGDQEQYSSLFALMARSLGYPVRVVMGFDPKVTNDSGKPVRVAGNTVTAWDEVAFKGVGWVPFFPTPKNPDVPQTQVPKPETQPQPQVRQPPRTNSDPDDLITPVEINKAKIHKKSIFDLPAWVIILGAIVLGLAILIFVPLLIVLGIKRRRMRARRTARGDRAAAGAWDEMVDQLSELGYAIPSTMTRTRMADRIGTQFVEPVGNLSGIAVLTDEAVFSGREIDREHAEQVWAEAMEATSAARSRLSRLRRIVSLYRVSAARAWTARLGVRAIAQTDALFKRRGSGGDDDRTERVQP